MKDTNIFSLPSTRDVDRKSIINIKKDLINFDSKANNNYSNENTLKRGIKK